MPVEEADVLADILRRDERDTGRAAAPLKRAPDAHLLDTTHLDIDAAFRAAIDIVEAVRAGRKRADRASVVEDEPAPPAFVTARPNLNHRFDRSVYAGPLQCVSGAEGP